MIDFAFSPCPNDTFCFLPLVKKAINKSEILDIRPHYHDIDTLNTLAKKGTYPVTKVSAFCLGKVSGDYVMLAHGAAIGHHVGPKLVSFKKLSTSDLKDSICALPGEETTASFLLHLLLDKPKKIIYLPYHKIAWALKEGHCDFGVIIHETRFSLVSLALHEVLDLGELYVKQTGHALPLGMIAAKKSLGSQKIRELSSSIKASIEFSFKYPDVFFDDIKVLSQEKDPKIIKSHIDLYVNSDTFTLSEKAEEAIEYFFKLAVEKKLLPREALSIEKAF